MTVFNGQPGPGYYGSPPFMSSSGPVTIVETRAVVVLTLIGICWCFWRCHIVVTRLARECFQRQRSVPGCSMQQLALESIAQIPNPHRVGEEMPKLVKPARCSCIRQPASQIDAIPSLNFRNNSQVGGYLPQNRMLELSYTRFTLD